MLILPIGMREALPEFEGKVVVVNTTSKSKIKLYRQLSPFFAGPVTVCPWDEEIKSENVENAWQFSKQYEEHSDEEHKEWSRKGFEDKKPHRFPMGRGRKPMHSRYKGDKLGYVHARFKIYAPLYAEAVVKTQAYEALEKHAAQMKEGEVLVLRDFDGYDYRRYGLTLEDTIYNKGRKWGHSFVLACLLSGIKPWETEYDETKVNHRKPKRKKRGKASKGTKKQA